MRGIKGAALGLAAVLLGLSGCAGAPAAGAQRSVALIAKSTQTEFWLSVFAGAEAAATEYNLSLTLSGPETEEDYEAQNQMIAQAVEAGADAIVFSAIDQEKNAAAIDEAARQGVRIVSIDSGVASDQVGTYIGTDNYLAGQMAAEAALDQAISNPEGFICVVEGAIPTAMDGKYGYVGGHTMLDLCKRVLPKAKAVVTMGTCAAYGGVQAAKPNPTGSVGVNDCFARLGMDVKAINIPGCPPNPLNLVGTLVAFLQNKEIKLDDLGRPLMFYGQSVHDLCERRVHFEAGEFAPSFDSEEARKGWCLYDLGCKGPSTYNNCPKALFNETNWPVRAGHPCIGCSEPNFWDDLSPFYQN